jgi:hypothetical protein
VKCCSGRLTRLARAVAEFGTSVQDCVLSPSHHSGGCVGDALDLVNAQSVVAALLILWVAVQFEVQLHYLLPAN